MCSIYFTESRDVSTSYVHVCILSRFNRVQPFATLWTIAHQAPRSMGLSRQECWSELPCVPPGEMFPSQGLNPCLICLLHWQEGSLPLVSLRKSIHWLYNMSVKFNIHERVNPRPMPKYTFQYTKELPERVTGR